MAAILESSNQLHDSSTKTLDYIRFMRLIWLGNECKSGTALVHFFQWCKKKKKIWVVDLIGYFFSVCISHKSEQAVGACACWLTHFKKILDVCHVDKFDRRWKKLLLVFFHAQPVCFPYWPQCANGKDSLALSGWPWSKIQTKCETKWFLPAAVSVNVS